jgi:hypothetical protein
MDSATATDAALARRVSRVSNDYLLRALRLLTDIHHGDMVDAIICQAIIAANTGHIIDARDPGEETPGAAGLPIDAQRKPISILALAGSLGLPFETTRRHVNRLIKSGACQRVKGGIIVPAGTLADPRFLHAAETNLAYVMRFVRGLKRAGVPLD